MEKSRNVVARVLEELSILDVEVNKENTKIENKWKSVIQKPRLQ